MDSLGIIKNIVLIFALTMDSFLVSFAYGAGKIRIPKSVIISMNLLISVMLGAAIYAGKFASSLLSEQVTGNIGFAILFCMGGYRLMACVMGKEQQMEKKREELTVLHGLFLAAGLSLDGVAVGVGAGMMQSKAASLMLGTFLAGILMMETGWYLGNCSRQLFRKDLSWMEGVCLLLLAISTLR